MMFKRILKIITMFAIIMLLGCGGADERKAAYLEKAVKSYELGDLEKARIDLKNVIQIDPKYAPPYFLLGKIHEQKRDYPKAFTNYNKAATIDPENVEYQAKIGRYYLLLVQDIEKAKEKMEAILKKDSTNIDGLLLKAGIYLKEGNKQASFNIVKDILKKNPDHVDTAIFTSSLYFNDKDNDLAIEVLEKARELNPENTELLAVTANMMFETRNYERAEILFKEILSNSPDVYEHYIRLALFYKKIEKNDLAESVLRDAIKLDPDQVERNLLLIEFIQQVYGNLETIVELNKLIKAYPDRGVYHIVLAKLYENTKKFDEAVAVYEGAIENFGEEETGIKARVGLARFYLVKKEYKKAQQYIDSALLISPSDANVHLINAQLALVNNDPAQAILSLRTVVKDNPENMGAYILLANAHYANKEDEQAKSILIRAYENNRINPEALLTLAKYYIKKKDTENAKIVIKDIRQIAPDNYDAMNIDAILLNVDKKFNEAKILADRMININPNLPGGYLQSVAYLMDKNDEGRAILLLKDGYKKTNKNITILEFLTRLDLLKGQYDSAVNRIEDKLAETKNIGLYIFLAKIQVNAKKFEDAVTTLNRIIRQVPGWDKPYVELSRLNVVIGKTDKAIEVLSDGLTKIPNSIELTFELARLYESQSHFNKAVKVYDDMLVNYPDNKVIINNLISLLSERMGDSESIARAKSYLHEIESVEAVAYRDTAAWAYYVLGNYDKAMELIKYVISKQPDNAIFNYHAGMIYAKSGLTESAKSQLTKALSRETRYFWRDKAEKQLSQLE